MKQNIFCLQAWREEKKNANRYLNRYNLTKKVLNTPNNNPKLKILKITSKNTKNNK